MFVNQKTILRAAQGGDRITATLPDSQTSISGSFVRTGEGRILIDMGYSHLVPEAEFARFGGRWAGWSPEYGMYHLQGANGERWATAISGTQMLNDIPCNTWDCVAIGIDLAAVGYAYTSEAAFWSTPVTTVGGAAGFTYGKLAQHGTAAAGVGWAEYQYQRGKASSADLWVARATAITGTTPLPVIGPVAATVQLAWDILDPLHGDNMAMILRIILYIPIVVVAAITYDYCYRNVHVHLYRCTLLSGLSVFAVGVWGTSLFTDAIEMPQILFGLVSAGVTAISFYVLGLKRRAKST